MRRNFQYRADLSPQTKANAEVWLHLCCDLYNLALEQRILVYRSRKITITEFDQNRQLCGLKEAFPEFKCVGSQVLYDVIFRLDGAYKIFFKQCRFGSGKPGFPRFKSLNRYDSFTLIQAGWKLEGQILTIKKVGKFKLRLSRPIEGIIKTVTVKRRPSGKWFVSFSCDNVPTKELPYTEKEVGIDVGIKSFLTDSDGNHVENPRYFRKSQKALRKKHRKLARRKKGSNRRQKAKILVAKANEKVTNQRKDFLHKLSTKLVSENKTICFEKLTLKGMIRNKHLSKSISDASWGMFIRFLTYKAEGAGRQAIGVNPRNTTQMCSKCGQLVPKTLAIRVHSCPYCGITLDRDHNAAINILRVGQTHQALTSGLPGVA